MDICHNKKEVDESERFSELSDIFVGNKINDIQNNDRLKNFYKKLIQTDARIRLLKKGFNNYNIVNTFDDKYKTSDRAKRSVKLINADSKIKRGKRLSNASDPTGVVIENKKVLVQYKPANSRKMVPKCTHAPKDSKSHEKKLKHPFYKNSQHLDELLDKFLDQNLPDMISNPFDLDKFLKSEKDSKICHDNMKHDKVEHIIEDTKGKSSTLKHKVTTKKEWNFEKRNDEDIKKLKRPVENDVLKDYIKNINIKDKGPTTETVNFGGVFSVSTSMNEATKSVIENLESKYHNSRKLMQVEEDDIDIAYNDVNEVLSDDGTPHDDGEVVAERVKRDDMQQPNETPINPMNDPNLKAPTLNPEELKSVIKQAALNNYRVKNNKDNLNRDLNDVEYLEDYLANEDNRLSKMAQAYSDYGVFEGKKDALRDGKNNNIEKSKDHRVKMSVSAVPEGRTKKGTTLEGIKYEFRPSNQVKRDDEPFVSRSPIYKIFQKHLKIKKEDNTKIPLSPSSLSTVPELLYTPAEITLGYNDFKNKFSYKADDASDNGQIFTLAKGKRTLKSISEGEEDVEYDYNIDDDDTKGDIKKHRNVFILQYFTSLNNNIKDSINVKLTNFEEIPQNLNTKNQIPLSSCNATNDNKNTSDSQFKDYVLNNENVTKSNENMNLSTLLNILFIKNISDFDNDKNYEETMANIDEKSTVNNIEIDDSTYSTDDLIQIVNDTFETNPSIGFNETTDDDNDKNYEETMANIDEKSTVHDIEIDDSTYSTDDLIQIVNDTYEINPSTVFNEMTDERSETLFTGDFYFDDNENNTETTTDASLITIEFEVNDFTNTIVNKLDNNIANDVFLFPSLGNNFEIDGVYNNTADMRLKGTKEISGSNKTIDNAQGVNKNQYNIKINSTLYSNMSNDQVSVKSDFSNEFKRKKDKIESNKNITENKLIGLDKLNATGAFENKIQYFDFGKLIRMLSGIFASFDGIAASQNGNKNNSKINNITTNQYVESDTKHTTENAIHIINDTIETSNLIDDTDVLKNIGHRSRVLLSLEDTNNSTVPEVNRADNLTNGREKEKITGDNLIVENFKFITKTNITAPINKISETNQLSNITNRQKEGKTIANKNNKQKDKNENKTIVKRNVDDSRLIFWNDLYDDEYGVKHDNMENTRGKHSIKDNNLIKSTKIWIKDKVKKIADHIKNTNKKFSRKKTCKPIKTTTDQMNTLFLPVQKESKIDKRMIKIRDDDEQEVENIDFAALTANMKDVCKKAALAVKETRNLEVREDSLENSVATSLMTQLIKLMTDLVDYQVQQKTCLRLPEDLQDFLQWLTGKEVDPELDSKKKLYYRSDDVSADMGIGNDDKSTEHEVENLPTPSSEEEEVIPERSDCLGTLRQVQDLIQLFDEMSEEDQSKMAGVREYLINQMDFLRKLSSYSDYNNFQTYKSHYPSRYKRNLENDKRFSRDSNDEENYRPRRKLGKFIKNFSKRYTRTTKNYYDSLQLTERLNRDIDKHGM